ncbi:phenolic acid decarboxylase [Nocardia carnea]|uniref:phenolic acid decarboxylase n=1 Tax=Nocardia carnea TaxID=37328 RepID=UPI00245897F0|nr:phenolic acid decarboxylase [Nocardia carnea]
MILDLPSLLCEPERGLGVCPAIRASPDRHMLNSIVGKHLRVHLSNGWVFEPWFTGPDFIEYQLEAGPHKGRHAIQIPTFRQIVPGAIESLHWIEETGTHVNLTWYLETQLIERHASVPRWLADHDMAVTTGQNWDPEYLAKIRQMAADGPDMPRHVYADRGYFEILDDKTVAKHSEYFGTERKTPKLNAHPYAHTTP